MGPIIAVKDELFKTFRQGSAPFEMFADDMTTIIGQSQLVQ